MLYVRPLTVFWCVTCAMIARASNSSAADVSVNLEHSATTSTSAIFTHSTGLDSLNLTTLSAQELFDGGHAVFQADALYDVDAAGFRLFWSDLQRGRLYGATYAADALSDVQEVAVVANGGGVVEGIAVDWLGLNVYWVDSRFGHIGLASINRTMMASIVEATLILIADMESPRAIAVDSNAGLLFWTDWDEEAPRIERCSLSGVERTVIVRTLLLGGGGFPNGLAIDYSVRRLYWIDAKSSGIYSTDYDGHDHVVLLANHPSIQWPFGLSVSDQSLFWVDAELKTINQIAVKNASDVRVLYKTYRTLYGILVLNPNRHPANGHVNPCYNNGGCSHLCTIESGGRKSTCHCPHMMSLSLDDSRSCHNVRDVVLVSESHKGVNLIQVLDAGNVVFRLVASPLVADNAGGDLYGLNMDLSTRTIYWADARTNAVWKASIADGKLSRVFDLGFGNLTGFAIDLSSKNAFYSMLGPHRGIFQCHLRPNYRCQRILLDVDRPLGLFFQSERRQLYWIESHSNGTHVIRRSSQDAATGDFGSIHDVFCTSSGLPTDLLVDLPETIYWRKIDDVRSVHKLVGNSSSIITIPDVEAGAVTAMTVIKNHKLAVGTSSGRVFTFTAANEGNLRTRRATDEHQDGDFWTSAQYKSKGTVAGLAYASSLIDEETTMTTSINATTDCSIRNCLNGGVCRPEPGQNRAWTCDCPSGFLGSLCEDSVCGDRYCKRGSCEITTSDGRLVCICPAGWSGQRCQFRSKSQANQTSLMAPAQSCDLLCLNGGTCFRSNASSSPFAASNYCSCSDQYFGSQCQIDSAALPSTSTSDSTAALLAMCILLVASVLATVVFYATKQRWRSTKMVKIANISSSSLGRATEMGVVLPGAQAFRRSLLLDCHPAPMASENDLLQLLSNCEEA